LAKNLKLNIKNAQLAEALKLSSPKKTSPKKEPKKPVEKPAVEVSESEKPSAPVVETFEPTPEPPKPEPVKTPVEEVAPPVVKSPVIKPAHPAVPARSEPQERHFSPKSDEKPPYQERRDYGARPRQPFQERRDYPSGGRPPYQDRGRPFTNNFSSSSRPPFQERRDYNAGGRPPSNGPSSAGRPGGYPPRPSYPSSRPPFVRREGSPPFRGNSGEDFKLDRRPLPPIKEPAKELPQQHQPHKKPAHFSAEKDAKNLKKGPSNRFDSRDRQGLRDNDDETWRKRKISKHKFIQQDEVIRPKELKIRLPITVKDLAVDMKLKASELIAKLFMKGVIITLNDYLDDETTVQLLGHDFDCNISIDTSEEERIRVTGKTIKQEIQEGDPDKLILRPPVVTFMGHVDHGKTSLVDTIRKSNIAATEAGAITQHIGAFQCHTQVGLITVLDTPGHEAFSSMRERGADVTDIIVLVIAGDEGIKAQTIEAIKQAQEAQVPLVVAINKCDKPGFDPDSIYRQLADQNLLPEVWGGSVITVNCSALTGQGIKELLEMLALQAEILELKADPSVRARGTVIESEMHKGMGSVATILVQNGTLKIGDALVFGQLYARVKTMHDEFGKELLEAGPSTPVKITGLSGVPIAGSDFIVVKNEKEAKEISEKRQGQKTILAQQAKRGSLENFLQSKAESGAKKSLNLIIKADVQGSLEALKTSLRKLPSQKVEMNFIVEGIGEISESDIQYASTSKATILGFHTRIESHAESLIKQLKVNVRLHNIIYHAVDDVRDLMLALLDKIPQENDLGKALVKTVFKSSQLGNIAGCIISEGLVRRNCHARLIRDKEVLWTGPIASLKRVKEDVKEVSKGYECGITLQGFSDFKENDIIQAYEIIYLQQELT
jgi:translation initiation factor IF-2